MRQIICDQCGADCTNGVCIIYMRIEHRTSVGEIVGDDDTKPRDLCLVCGEAARKALGLVVRDKPEGIEVYEGDIPQSLPPGMASAVRRLGPHGS